MAYFAPLPGKRANGNISPRRFLTIVTGAGNSNLVVQATAASQILLGVSQDTTRFPPGSPGDDGLLAVAGEPVPYYGPGMICLMDLGGTVDGVTGSYLLTSDGSGKAVAAAPADGTTQYFGALALGTGVSGDVIRVIVLAPTPTV